MNTEAQVSLLTSELYYDLLDKYVKLQEDYDKLKQANRAVKMELYTYKEFNTKDPELLKTIHNQRLNEVNKIVSKNNIDYKKTIKTLNEFKIK